MIAKYNRKESWEKCSVYDLENGWQAALQYNHCYGEFVSRLSNDGKSWHASDGYDNPYATSSDPSIAKVFADHIALPEFARSWIEVVNKTADQTLVRPRFEKVYEKAL